MIANFQDCKILPTIWLFDTAVRKVLQLDTKVDTICKHVATTVIPPFLSKVKVELSHEG